MHVRRLEAADAGAYRALMLEAYATEPAAFLSEVTERAALPMEWWAERLAGVPATSTLVLGAFDSGRLGGTVGVEFGTRRKTLHTCTVFGLHVATSLRRCGVARALMRRLLDELTRHPETEIAQLTVTDGNAAASALYESLRLRLLRRGTHGHEDR